MATTSRAAPPLLEPDDEPHAIAAEQRLELMAAQAYESDRDLAFQLQMHEALSASLSVQPSSSSSPPPNPSQLPQTEAPALHFFTLQTEELDRFERERRDRLIAEAEMKRIKNDLRLLAHDREVASEIHRMPEEMWENIGDNFERPFGEGTSNASGENSNFRVYCKGLVSDECGDGSKAVAGIGVAICDSADNMIFELRKPFVGNRMSRRVVEMKAVIEGLTVAIALDLKRVVFYFDYYPFYQFIIGRWPAKQQNIAALVGQVNQLRGKFLYSAPALVARNDIRFAFRLAREAIASQSNRSLGSCSSAKNIHETCNICLEDKDVSQFFSVNGCSHRYCCSCMKQHVEVKLLHGMVAKCPHEGCNSELKIESCRIFLTPKLIETMNLRLKEASIPVTERVYCPYPKCSYLMTKTEVLEYSRKSVCISQPGVRKCMKCGDLFCIICKVPWHMNMSCHEYKRRNPHPPAEDAKLKRLANRNFWRQCIKCNHMIELVAGCYHMTCRCGYEFCYTCGAEWKNKKPTCSCPLWDEDNILYNDDYDDDESDEELDDHDYYAYHLGYYFH